MFSILAQVRQSRGDALTRFGFNSGYIYFKLTSLHLQCLFVTDRPLCWCQTMEGMNEQSDLTVLTSVAEIKKKETSLSTRSQSAGMLLPNGGLSVKIK